MTDGQALLAALSHPLRREIIRHAVKKGRALSPDELAKDLGKHLNDVSYHVRVLSNAGVLILVDEQPARGSLRHLYVHDDAVVTVDWVRELLGLPR